MAPHNRTNASLSYTVGLSQLPPRCARSAGLPYRNDLSFRQLRRSMRLSSRREREQVLVLGPTLSPHVLNIQEIVTDK